MGTVHVVPAVPDVRPEQAALLRRLGAREWTYLGGRSRWRLAHEKALDGAAEWRSIADELDATSGRLRDPFLDLMGALTARNDGRAWWGTRLANKNPYTSSFFIDSCLASVARDLCRAPAPGGRLIVIESPAVLDAVAAHAHRVGGRAVSPRTPITAVRQWAAWWKGYLQRRHELRRAGLFRSPVVDGDTALLFTWSDGSRVTPDGRYSDLTLGDALLTALRDTGHRLAFVMRALGNVAFRTLIERLRATGETFLFRDALLEPADLARAIVRSATYRPSIPRPLRLDGLDVSGLATAQLASDRGEMADNLTYHALLRRLARAGRPRLVVHSMEGHSWERVLARAVREYLPGTPVVATNSGTFSSRWLSVFASPVELAHVPLPDRVITNGPRLAKVLRDGGYPASRVVVGADFRRAYLWERDAPVDAPAPSPPARVLVAAEIDLDRSLDLLDKTLHAFADRPGYDVVVKSHPTVPVDALTTALGARARAGNIHFSSLPIAELLPQAHAVLYTQTTVCLEALRFGVVPVFVRLEGGVNLDPLEHAPECRRTATTPVEIRAEVDAVARMAPDAWRAWCAHAQSVLADHLGRVTPDVAERCFAPSRATIAAGTA